MSTGDLRSAICRQGTYTLVAWQEKAGSQELVVTVGGDKPAEVTIEYHP